MRIVAISDTHGMHRQLTVPTGDILIHAGDLTRLGNLQEVRDFNAWIGELPHANKVVIAGNHDWCFEEHPRKARELLTNCTYLKDEMTSIEGVTFYGSPWQPVFCNWAFNLSAEDLAVKWSMIPSDVDVLITHGPPFGFLDRTARGECVGCDKLRDEMNRIKPGVHVFGHIHEGYGYISSVETQYYNASTCNLRYKPANPPIIFEV